MHFLLGLFFVVLSTYVCFLLHVVFGNVLVTIRHLHFYSGLDLCGLSEFRQVWNAKSHGTRGGLSRLSGHFWTIQRSCRRSLFSIFFNDVW